MQLKYKVTSALAAGTLFLSLAAPVAYADNGGPDGSANLEISGNGDHSDNTITVKNTCTTSVTQTNVSTVNVDAKSKANTGGNQASGNTGGDVNLTSGDATANTTVSVSTGFNEATVDPCCCLLVDPQSALISGNGTHSDNDVKVKNKNSLNQSQTNVTTVGVKAKSKAKTGKNKAKHNTGGSVDLTSGVGVAGTDVTVTTGGNVLNP